jgi:polyisoprenoid-binding protein YceI
MKRQHRWSIRIAAWVCAATAATVALGAAEVYEIRPGEPNLVRFESKAPMESFSGSTRQAQGTLTFDPSNLGDSIDMVVEVDLASLDTGIPLRNEHMRKNHLETERYPQAVFHVRRLLEASAGALGTGRRVSLVAEGDFSLHGVTKRIRVPVEVERQEEKLGGGVRILSRFQVLLPDYEIARPKFLVLKLDELQRVTVDLLAMPRR